MKTSALIKALQKLKRKHGDIEVAFDETSVNPEAELEYCIQLVEPVGAFRVRWNDSSRHKPLIILAVRRSTPHILNCDPAPIKKIVR